jgi:altronate dehydratase
VTKYGQPIGQASVRIEPGQHVHDHNVDPQPLAQNYAFATDTPAVEITPRAERRTFLGIKRANGRVGTRNYVAIIPSVHCSVQACRGIARHFTPDRLAPFPNVDGILVLSHIAGCGGSMDYDILQRTLAGMARHPNVGAYVLVGLGCEGNQVGDMAAKHGLVQPGSEKESERGVALIIQDLGGTAKTVRAGISAVTRMLPVVNQVERTPQPLSELWLATQCGGSDGWSGITANPLVGRVADEIARQGGAVVLSETPEIYGAEHLLTRRAIDEKAGQKLLARLHWWEEYVQRQGTILDNNPGPGNRAGGLSNIYEKSLGAIAKSGSTPLMAVYDYAEPLDSRGLLFMDAPGDDAVSITGMVAGGCNMVVFTTGRGSVSGAEGAPCIKVCSNSATFERMSGDMDLNAGRLLDPHADPAELAEELLTLVIAVASGQRTKSEQHYAGEGEFMPWTPVGTI